MNQNGIRCVFLSYIRAQWMKEGEKFMLILLNYADADCRFEKFRVFNWNLFIYIYFILSLMDEHIFSIFSISFSFCASSQQKSLPFNWYSIVWNKDIAFISGVTQKCLGYNNNCCVDIIGFFSLVISLLLWTIAKLIVVVRI